MGVSGPLVSSCEVEALSLLWAIYPQLMPGYRGLLAIPGFWDDFSQVRCLTTLPSTSLAPLLLWLFCVERLCQYPFKAVLFKMVPTSVTFCSQQPVLWAHGVVSRWTREPGSSVLRLSSGDAYLCKLAIVIIDDKV